MLEKIDDGGPAYPGECGASPSDPRRGMSLRAYFAGQALAAQAIANQRAELRKTQKRASTIAAEVEIRLAASPAPTDTKEDAT